MTRGAEGDDRGGAVAVLPEPLAVDDEAVQAAAKGAAQAVRAARPRTAWRRDADFAPRVAEPASVAPTLRA